MIWVLVVVVLFLSVVSFVWVSLSVVGLIVSFVICLVFISRVWVGLVSEILFRLFLLFISSICCVFSCVSVFVIRFWVVWMGISETGCPSLAKVRIK